ncbi:tetratricopeptide repeat protein [Pseudodesulfovibrio methanolicus]|uniref:Tetratricopeptide repeat protein n=1 Tax=Pseudodesulfovibrio methanolicus TaxID=3126690 RepID=A0ABZ2IZE9_9BACT
MKRVLVLSLLAFFPLMSACSPHPPADPLVAGVLSDNIGQHSMAQDFFEEAANNGDPRGAYRLGERAEKGIGGKKNMAAAVRWYREAQKLGYPQADFKLGVLYIEGKGVPKDAGMAAEHFSRAAKGGSPYGAIYMSMLCLDGNGVEKDSVQAYL